MSSPEGERSVPYYCPYCGDEDLRPHDATPGTWECRACTRVFAVKMLGMIHTREGEHGRDPDA